MPEDVSFNTKQYRADIGCAIISISCGCLLASFAAFIYLFIYFCMETKHLTDNRGSKLKKFQTFYNITIFLLKK